MTVTALLLTSLSFLVGGVVGAMLYQWLLNWKLQKSIESSIAKFKDEIDFHQVALKDGKQLTIAKSSTFDNSYIVEMSNAEDPMKKCGLAFFDKNTFEVVSHGTVDI